MTEPIPILVDTDIGSDIDDAVALSYLLRQERCELVGITTVGGYAQQRAACAEVLCREVSQTDIPIYCGASEPLLTGSGQPLAPQYEGIRHRAHTLERKVNQAVDFLRHTIRANPGKITLLSIGPFTNIALLFAIDPEIPSLLKGFVSMAGSFFKPMIGYVPAEFNVRADPLASSLVYNKQHSYPRPHLSVSIDVTGQCCMGAKEVRARFAAKPLNVALEMAEIWFSKHDQMAYHDPLAAALIFEPQLCTYVEGRVEVPIHGEPAGQTLFPEAGGHHQVTATVDTEAFFRHFFDVCN